MVAPRSRKIRLTYFIAMLMTLGFIVPVMNIALLPAYLAFTSSLAGLAALMFGANVAGKKLNENVYMKQLEMIENDNEEDPTQ